MSENRSVVEPKQFLEHTESEIFPFQVSGHDLMLRTNDGNIVKVASEREVRFYERVSDHSPELLEFIPVYHGILGLHSTDDLRKEVCSRLSTVELDEMHMSPWTKQVLKKEIKRRKPDSEHIVISDLTSDFFRPNIIDIKLGTLHHSQAREERKPTKYQTALTLGYCLGGAMLWDEELSAYKHMDKYMGRRLTEDTIESVVALFFTHQGRVRKNVVTAMIARLRDLLAIFEQQTTWRFHSTSLLLVYEPDDSAAPVKYTVALVDFAHAYMNHAGVDGRQPQVDAGCQLGVSNVMAALQRLLDTPPRTENVTATLAAVANPDGGSSQSLLSPMSSPAPSTEPFTSMARWPSSKPTSRPVTPTPTAAALAVRSLAASGNLDKNTSPRTSGRTPSPNPARARSPHKSPRSKGSRAARRRSIEISSPAKHLNNSSHDVSKKQRRERAKSGGVDKR